MSGGCPACGFQNSGDAIYCGGCGAPLGPTCTSCGAGPLPPGVAFCTACGAEQRRPDTGLERKIVSVVFVDVVGFTSMAERLDPEDVRRLLDPYYVRARQELERYGGTVEKFIGDAVMALFGAPVAHEDDAERAVRAAHAVRAAVAGLKPQQDGPRLEVRIGIATGEAVVDTAARPEEGVAMAHGDVVNTAARLQSGAPIGGILVDERTYRGTRFQISFRVAPALQVKGKAEPVPVWEAVTPRGRTGLDPSQHHRALIGRERELAAAGDLLDEAIACAGPRQTAVCGPPGIGKSRLVWELFQRVEQRPEMIFWRQGRSLPYGDGVSFWALAEIVKGHAGVLATDDLQTVEEKLRIAVEDVIPTANEARWVEAHLAPLAGLVGRDLRGDSRTEAFTAWRRFFEAIAARSPLILVLEDLHWADADLLEFVTEHLGERFAGPLLTVVTYRPELLERHPAWTPGRRAVVLELAPLSDTETAGLVSELLEVDELPPALRAALLGGAGGNPLYAKEYASMLLDRGLLRQGAGGLELSGDELPLPESVQAIVAARLDGLPPDEKRLVRDAAVVGKAFWLGALAAVSSQPRWSVEHHLYELERKGLVRRMGESVVRSEPQLSFSHVIVRDVAYEQLPRAGRADKHRRAAVWLDSLSPERSEDRSEMLAHHYLSALRFSPAGDGHSHELGGHARAALRDAGDRAAGLHAFAKAARFYTEALALLPEAADGRGQLLLDLGRARMHAESAGDDVLGEARDALLLAGDDERAAEAMELIGELEWMRGDPGAFAHLEQAAELLAGAPPSYAKAHVLGSLARFNMIRDHNEEAVAVGDEALRMAEELGIAELRAHVLASTGLSRARLGDPQGIRDLEESVEVAVAENSLESIRGYANLGNALVERGELARAFELYERGGAEAARFGDADRIRWFEVERMYQCYWRGSWEDALALADGIMAEVEAGFPTAYEQDARLVRGRIRLARDDDAGAGEDASRALELGERAGYPEMLVPALALQGRLLEADGRRERAQAAADRLLEIWPERCPTSYWVGDVAATLAAAGRSALFQAAAGRAPAESRWLDAARALAGDDHAAAAASYAAIGSVPDEALARLASAQRAAADGRRADAEREARPAVEAFRQLRATRYLRSAEPLLALPA